MTPYIQFRNSKVAYFVSNGRRLYRFRDLNRMAYGQTVGTNGVPLGEIAFKTALTPKSLTRTGTLIHLRNWPHIVEFAKLLEPDPEPDHKPTVLETKWEVEGFPTYFFDKEVAIAAWAKDPTKAIYKLEFVKTRIMPH